MRVLLGAWLRWLRTGGILALLIASAHADETLRTEARSRLGRLAAPPAGRLTEPVVGLGRQLFWDPRISADGRTSCASCHRGEDWGSDHRRFPIDARGKPTARHSQTVFNAMLQPSLRWTGDRTSGVHQAHRSITGSMGFAGADDVVGVLREHGYQAAFDRVFASEPSAERMTPLNYARALQAYQETLVTPAPFDRFLEGDDTALTAEQKRGLGVFLRTGCADCHRGPLLGGGSIRKFGVEKEYWSATGSTRRDAGLFESTRKEADRYRFRVSMLRNIARTGPYFHDGSVDDLAEAVQVMADVQLGNRMEDPEATAVVAFLESLTGEVPSHYRPPKGPEAR